jgi:predicted acylesterase/phospholipase RssA
VETIMSEQQTDVSWFSLARQPQEPLSPDGPTLTGRELERWRERFRPLNRHLKHRDVIVALSGGGMLLPCHVGALRVLELAGVPLDRIFGTSAGAIVGGLFAAGLTTADLEETMLAIESPDEIFGFAARYPRLRMVTREVRRILLDLPPEESGVYDLEQVEEFVSDTLARYVGRVPRLGELDIDFSCVALDLGTGHEGDENVLRKRVFSRESAPDVSLSDAIAASMAIPGVFPPKRIEGRYYVDGGVIEQLPIGTAREEWMRTRPRFSRRKLAILGIDLGPPGEAPSLDVMGHPMDLVIYTQRLQGRVITELELIGCHEPRRRNSVILVRPANFEIALYEIEKIPLALHDSYRETLHQLAGDDFLAITEQEIEQARGAFGICRE